MNCEKRSTRRIKTRRPRAIWPRSPLRTQKRRAGRPSRPRTLDPTVSSGRAIPRSWSSLFEANVKPFFVAAIYPTTSSRIRANPTELPTLCELKDGRRTSSTSGSPNAGDVHRPGRCSTVASLSPANRSSSSVRRGSKEAAMTTNDLNPIRRPRPRLCPASFPSPRARFATRRRPVRVSSRGVSRPGSWPYRRCRPADHHHGPLDR